MSAPEPTVDTLEIEASTGRERFGFGTLDRPDKGCVIVARMGLGGFGKENLNRIAQVADGPLPGAFLALHRRRLKKQRLLTLVAEEGFGEECFDYWVFHNASLATGCVLGLTTEDFADDPEDVTIHSERWFQSPTLAAARERIFGLWERDFIDVQRPAFGYRKLLPGTLPLDRLRRNWQALFDNEECRANLDDDEITFEAFWQECLDDK